MARWGGVKGFVYSSRTAHQPGGGSACLSECVLGLSLGLKELLLRGAEPLKPGPEPPGMRQAQVQEASLGPL